MKSSDLAVFSMLWLVENAPVLVVLLLVGADPNLSHRADRILSQGWRPVLS